MEAGGGFQGAHGVVPHGEEIAHEPLERVREVHRSASSDLELIENRVQALGNRLGGVVAAPGFGLGRNLLAGGAEIVELIPRDPQAGAGRAGLRTVPRAPGARR